MKEGNKLSDICRHYSINPDAIRHTLSRLKISVHDLYPRKIVAPRTSKPKKEKKIVIPKRRKKYWDDTQFKDHLKAYLEEENPSTKNRIYWGTIYPLLVHMAEIIWRRYFAWRNPELAEMETDYTNDAVCHVTSKLEKFDMSRNSFSFFQTVIKIPTTK